MSPTPANVSQFQPSIQAIAVALSLLAEPVEVSIAKAPCVRKYKFNGVSYQRVGQANNK